MDKIYSLDSEATECLNNHLPPSTIHNKEVSKTKILAPIYLLIRDKWMVAATIK